MTDAVEQLCDLLVESGARVTFDSGRNNTRPCTFCGTLPESAFELVTIGTYFDGEQLTRPVCKRCMPIAAMRCRKREGSEGNG